MARYFGRKLAFYGLTFFIAVTVDWLIPRFMPGDPVQLMISRITALEADAVERMTTYFRAAFGLDKPLWEQYANFWLALLNGDLGISVWQFPQPVTSVILGAVPYSIALLLPVIVVGWYVGNRLGAVAARRPWLDNRVLPLGYLLTATPYMWLAIILAWIFASTLRLFPISGGYGFGLAPSLSLEFIGSLLHHWFLPFLSLLLVEIGGWAIGMRNLIIYELEADYARYLRALGAPERLVRRYAFRNALLPQLSGLALKLGVVVAGALVTEVVFAYPGLGYLILQAIINQDYFLLQGVFLFIVLGVLIANFVIDVAYVVVDPRTRLGMQGGNA